MGRTAVGYGNRLLAEKLWFNGKRVPWKICHNLGWWLLILPCGILDWIWLLDSSFVLSFKYVWCAIAILCLLLVVSLWTWSIGYCCQLWTLWIRSFLSFISERYWCQSHPSLKCTFRIRLHNIVERECKSICYKIQDIL